MFYFRKDKPKEVVCTICSREKVKGPLLMPAHKRYLGEHIGLTRAAAGRKPFFILSGVHGLISAKTEIEYYDHRLQDTEVAALAERVARQVRLHKIGVLYFYHEPKQSWRPYTAALSAGVIAGGGGIVHIALPTQEQALQTLPFVVAPAIA